jgi:hypothetical protein
VASVLQESQRLQQAQPTSSQSELQSESQVASVLQESQRLQQAQPTSNQSESQVASVLQGSQRLQATSSQELQTESQVASCLPKDNGRKIVFDNFDFLQQVHHMTEHHQNVDIHWVSHMAVENRVPGNNLSSTQPSDEKLLAMENGNCMPTRYEHHLQRENYITLTERIIVEIPCLEFLKPHIVNHIPHQYSREMAQKSDMVIIINL